MGIQPVAGGLVSDLPLVGNLPVVNGLFSGGLLSRLPIVGGLLSGGGGGLLGRL
jgi:hypothetical protein